MTREPARVEGSKVRVHASPPHLNVCIGGVGSEGVKEVEEVSGGCVVLVLKGTARKKERDDVAMSLLVLSVCVCVCV